MPDIVFNLNLRTCLSFAGFQSGSKRTKRLAPTRFTPQPPALLLSKKAKLLATAPLGSLNLCTQKNFLTLYYIFNYRKKLGQRLTNILGYP